MEYFQFSKQASVQYHLEKIEFVGPEFRVHLSIDFPPVDGIDYGRAEVQVLLPTLPATTGSEILDWIRQRLPALLQVPGSAPASAPD